jgi:hypothetical protein
MSANTYRETVRRFRVMRQLNDFERNPNGDWSLVYSTNDIGDAYEVADDYREQWKRCGDTFKVVDAGRETWIERSMW